MAKKVTKASIDREFKAIAADLTQLYKKQIQKQKLIKTGLLLATIEVKARKTPKGYALAVYAPEYWVYVDAKAGVTKKIFRSVGYAKLKKRIQVLYSLMVKAELTA